MPAEASLTDWQSITEPRHDETGFREYDLRWLYPDQINLPGMFEIGRGLGTLMQQRGMTSEIVVGCDFRSYSRSVCHALALGLIDAGIKVTDVGTVLSPIVYFARVHLGISAMAMVTASHNPDGWTGVKFGFQHPRTCSPEEMKQLKSLVFGKQATSRSGGSYCRNTAAADAYLESLTQTATLTRTLRIVCATGNGTASTFAPELLKQLGMTVIPRHSNADCSFPHYNPNPESLEMLRDMRDAVTETGADLALGFDGDGDRLGVVDNTASIIHADKAGLLIARHLAPHHPGSRILVDIKSTALFADDPVLREHGIHTEYWKTGHGHIKARLAETGALAAFERSGHYYFGATVGHGFDCALHAARALCQVLDDQPGKSLAVLHDELPMTWMTPSMDPPCPDQAKYPVVDRITDRLKTMDRRGEDFAGQNIASLLTINGVRVTLTNGSWTLIRASSNTPNLVVVCESKTGREDLQRLVETTASLLHQEPEIGPFELHLE